MKKHEIFQKALNTLGLTAPDHIKGVEDVIGQVKQCELNIEDMLNVIESAKECIEEWKKIKDEANDILAQVKIEEYKALNPNAKNVYLF